MSLVSLPQRGDETLQDNLISLEVLCRPTKIFGLNAFVLFHMFESSIGVRS